MKSNIIIATIKSWNIDNVSKLNEIINTDFDIFIFSDKESINFDAVKKINPKYIFFPHWSWKIPKEIYSNFNCVVFHLTDLPYGRGGSPVQNLIANKIYDTKISAFKVEDGLDMGDIYLKESFDISRGSVEEILMDVSNIIFYKLIPEILKNNPIPQKQEGIVTHFNRRTSELSDIKNNNFLELNDWYDFIRMLDGEGYPRAFIKIGNFKLIFSEAQKKSNKITGRFEINYENE